MFVCIIFSVCLVICSFRTAGIFEKNSFWNMACISVILLFVIMTYHAYILAEGIKLKGGGYNAAAAAVVFLLSLCVHLAVAWAIGQHTQQISDFGNALELSRGDFPLTETPDHYRIFSNWGIYPLYLKLIQELFGYGAFTAIVLNALICAVSSMLIYILCRLGFQDERVGFLGALIYTFWPSHLLYSVILSPEFLNIFLTLLFMVLLEMLIGRYHKRSVYGMTCLAAVVLSLAGFFKQIDKIILIASGIMFVILILQKKFLICKKTFLILALFAGCYILSGKLIYAGLDYAYGETVNRNPAMHFIYIGLNPETYGVWSDEVFHVYPQNVKDCNYDFKQASDLTFTRLKEEIAEKKHLQFPYFAEKFRTAWADNSEIWWVDVTLRDDSAFLKKTHWLDQMSIFTQNFWMVICILICAEAVFLFVNPRERYMYMWLILFGFACLLTLSEVQSRYKCVVYPVLSILAADGIVKLLKLLKNVFFSLQQTGKRLY